MNRNEAIAHLVKCSDANGKHWHGGREWFPADTCPTCHGTDDASHMATDGSRYGYHAGDVAPIAYRHAAWFARETGQELDTRILDASMSDAVNDSPDIASDLQGYAAELAGANVDAMVVGYVECQLWAGLDWDHERCNDDCDRENAHPWDEHYSRDDVSPEYVAKVRDELAAFVAAHPLAVRMYLNFRHYYHAGENGVIVRKRQTLPSFDSAQFGHDLYLTREGHGAGFWDRGLGELGDYLTQRAKWAGAADDLTDDGAGVLG